MELLYHMMSRMGVIYHNISPAENQFDLEMAYKVFFFSDSCSQDLADKESN